MASLHTFGRNSPAAETSDNRSDSTNSRILFLVCIGVAGCSDTTNTQQCALSGTAVGATSGAVLGAIGGNAALGAVVGAGASLAVV
ncbi:MAG TPA: hypothetical protein DDZ81_24535 [Acetobacteraceae bacterium]|nr:hypothetical protein [Acetobacteraceae bacterium]